MSENEFVQDVALIGLGGSGIRTMMALRALIEKEEAPALGVIKNSCRLLAIDDSFSSRIHDYFPDLDEDNREGILLEQKEYLGLLHSGENPWDKVTKDAKSNIPEAVKLLSQRPVILINRSADRLDYKAMIYVSRERMKQAIQDFLKNSEKSKKHSVRPIKLIIATSLIGNAGSLSYLALLEILNELSEEIRCESINSVLFGPEVFVHWFPPHPHHLPSYFSVVRAISNFCFKEGIERIVPNQYLVSLYPGTSVHLLPQFTIFKEMAKKAHELIFEESVSENRVQDDGGDSLIEMVPLNLEKCLEIKNSFADRLAADRYFSHLVQEYCS